MADAVDGRMKEHPCSSTRWGSRNLKLWPTLLRSEDPWTGNQGAGVASPSLPLGADALVLSRLWGTRARLFCYTLAELLVEKAEEKDDGPGSQTSLVYHSCHLLSV